MPYEANLDLSKFTTERYLTEDEQTRRSYIEAIFRRFPVPDVTLVGHEIEWRNRSYTYNDAQMLARFFGRNSHFGPNTNLAQLLQIFCCQRTIKDYRVAPLLKEYADCRKTAENKFSNLASYLSTATFGSDAQLQAIGLRNIWVGDLEIPANKRLTLRSPKREGNMDSLVEQIRQNYPSATGPFRQI
jgi:hypothetical protein